MALHGQSHTGPSLKAKVQRRLMESYSVSYTAMACAKFSAFQGLLSMWLHKPVAEVAAKAVLLVTCCQALQSLQPACSCMTSVKTLRLPRLKNLTCWAKHLLKYHVLATQRAATHTSSNICASWVLRCMRAVTFGAQFSAPSPITSSYHLQVASHINHEQQQ